ncbi:MAG: 30S ribosomal protein S9 [Mycoplasmataceae bacterium]|jgi:small subunit ribosomal protein S9|nr:30S ribosomal protein S9 [Mycoplasmataceae bacterium]
MPAKKKTKTTTGFKGLGRRKSSVAHVILTEGTGKIHVNKKTLKAYFPNDLVIQDLMQPLVLLDLAKQFDVEAKVVGGGFTGQAGAIRLAITNALVALNPEYKPNLKTKHLVTRDQRVKERKKFGKYGARRSPQFTKR